MLDRLYRLFEVMMIGVLKMIFSYNPKDYYHFSENRLAFLWDMWQRNVRLLS